GGEGRGWARVLVVGGGGDRAGLKVGREPLGRDVVDVAAPVVQRFDDVPDDVQHENAPSRVGKRLRERNAYVARPDDGHVVGARGLTRLHLHGPEGYRAEGILSAACPSP